MPRTARAPPRTPVAPPSMCHWSELRVKNNESLVSASPPSAVAHAHTAGHRNRRLLAFAPTKQRYCKPESHCMRCVGRLAAHHGQSAAARYRPLTCSEARLGWRVHHAQRASTRAQGPDVTEPSQFKTWRVLRCRRALTGPRAALLALTGGSVRAFEGVGAGRFAPRQRVSRWPARTRATLLKAASARQGSRSTSNAP